VFHIPIWGGWEMCLGGAKPTKAPQWRRDWSNPRSSPPCFCLRDESPCIRRPTPSKCTCGLSDAIIFIVLLQWIRLSDAGTGSIHVRMEWFDLSDDPDALIEVNVPMLPYWRCSGNFWHHCRQSQKKRCNVNLSLNLFASVKSYHQKKAHLVECASNL